MATPEVTTRSSTLSHPKTTLLAIDHLIEHLAEPRMISAIGKAVGRISGLGVDEKLDIISIAAEILGNEEMAQLVQSLTDNHEEVNVSAAIAEIIIATAWKCLSTPDLRDSLGVFESIARQIDAISGQA